MGLKVSKYRICTRYGTRYKNLKGLVINLMDCDEASCTNGLKDKSAEERMIEDILSGDTSLVSKIFELYETKARTIARRFLGWDESRIEDVIQEAMMKAYLNLNRLRDRGKFENWYLKIVRNIALDSARRQNIYANHPDDENGKDFESWAAYKNAELKDVPERFFVSDIIEKIKEELEGLDTDYKEPIRLRYMEELSYNEIADILKKPLGTIKSLIHRGKAILRDKLDVRVGVSA